MEVQMEPDKVSDGAWYPDEYYLLDRIPLVRFFPFDLWKRFLIFLLMTLRVKPLFIGSILVCFRLVLCCCHRR